MKLGNTLDAYDFNDLGFSCPKYTWSNNQEGAAPVQERIDRAWENQ